MKPLIWSARIPHAVLCACLALTGMVGLRAQTPPPPAKRLPPAGIEISAADRAELSAGAEALGREIAAVTREKSTPREILALLPDVEVFHKAVDWALRYDEFFDANQVAQARDLLRQGHERASQLRRGETPWLDSTSLVIRGYRSKLDDSVQPYAVVVPATWKRNGKDRPVRRLDVVLPGRNEKRTELAFIVERGKSAGDIVPEETIVLHPYGRYCNATKFAGEVDVFEAIAAVRRNYGPTGHTVVRGFSMGGASAWHLAAHHPGEWRAASPGAGFAETAVYTKARAPGKEPPTWWEEKLWNWYDATAYAGNLFNLPTVAYSGEIDPQKQSADIMEQAMAAEGLKLERLIGPKTGHSYHPETKKELAARLEALVAGPADSPSREIRLTTYTLRYPKSDWVEIFGLEKHWDRADVVARLDEPSTVNVRTKNVTRLRLKITGQQPAFTIDGQKVAGAAAAGSPDFWFTRTAGAWTSAPSMPNGTAHKIPGLTGPIDDAFMESFVFVRPTGKPLHEKSAAWVGNEVAHATKMWRDLFRGDPRVKNDTAVTAADIANSNLVLWGDPSSNKIIAQILGRLPLKWDTAKLVFRGKEYDSGHHMPVLIFPNPLNPQRYIVLNSGIDFRSDAYGTNALQIPKLPDYAIVDLDTPPGPKWPGKIVDAGFFNEEWK